MKQAAINPVAFNAGFNYIARAKIRIDDDFGPLQLGKESSSCFMLDIKHAAKDEPRRSL